MFIMTHSASWYLDVFANSILPEAMGHYLFVALRLYIQDVNQRQGGFYVEVRRAWHV